MTACQALPASAVSMIYRSMTDVMARRLTGTATPTCRDPPAIAARAPTDGHADA
jgi:hypothetical protein